MIKRWQKLLNQINRATDFLIIITCYYGAVYLWLVIVKHETYGIVFELSRSGLLAAVLALFTVFLYYSAGLYASLRARPIRHDIKWVLFLNAVVVAIGAMLLFVFRLEDFSRGIIGLFYLFSSAMVLLKRIMMRALLSYFRKRGLNQKHVILIGSGTSARHYIETIRMHPVYGYTIDGYIGEQDSIEGVPHLGAWEIAGDRYLLKPGIDEVVVALDQENIGHFSQVIEATERHGTKLSIIPYFSEYIPASTTFETLGDCKLLNVRTTPFEYPGNALLKRGMDLFGSLLLIVLTSPIMLLAAIGVKLSSPGPVIFRQVRIGKNKRPFQMYKFRSMRVNTEAGTAWTRNDDPRKTRFGSFIRKTSIDELPQLFNVLRGEMSLIGPRPEISHFVDQFRETIPLYMLKHLVRPGITGWAQVNGYRGDTSIEERIKRDIWYIENWSFWLDIRICIMTVFGGLINKETLR